MTPEDKGTVLDRNVDQLLRRAHEPPQMDSTARARILDNLKSQTRKRPGRESETPNPVPLPIPARNRIIAAVTAIAAVIAVGWFALGPSEEHQSRSHLTNPTPGAERVELPDGSSVILNRGAEVHVVGNRRVRIDSGDAIFDIAKSTRPFIVESAQGQIRVLGTRFLVRALGDQTRAAVIRGRVEIKNGTGKTLLTAGDEGVLENGKAPTRAPARRLSHLTSWAKGARKRQEKPEPGPARRGNLLARFPNWQQHEFPLPMRDLTVDVVVENQVARVAIDQTFFNHRTEQLEGVYMFPLPPDAAINRLAMYVGENLMEAGIVERQRARRIYEQIVYQRRDPALLEWMAGNMFKVRIFPLFGRQEKRILLSYTQSLSRLYDDYTLQVPIPEVDDPVRTVEFRVRLANCADCEIRSTSHELSTEKQGRDQIVSFSASNHRIGDDLLLAIRDPADRPRVATFDESGRRYWMARLKPRLPAQTRGDSARRRWVVLDDTSASRKGLERKAQTHIVDRLLEELDEDDQLSVVAFDATLRELPGGFSRVGDVERRDVFQFLEAESRDGVGHTDLEKALERAAKLLEGAAADGYEPHILYLGDGIITGGDSDPKVLAELISGKATFIGVSVGELVDASVLHVLARQTGGMATAMNPGDDLDWRVFDLVASLNTPRAVDLSASVDGAKGDVFVSSTQLADGEELSLVALLDGPAPSSVKLRGMVGGETWSQTVSLKEAERGDGAGYLPRIWAQRRIESLIAGGKTDNQKEITQLGLDHWLMTPFTSLLVLENEKMYKEFKVTRSTDAGWAGYKTPKKIKVVHEPVGVADRPLVGIALDAILARSPIQVFQSYGTNPYSAVLGRGLGGGGISPINGNISGTTGFGASGTGPGFGRGGGGKRTSILTKPPRAQRKPKLAEEAKPAESPAPDVAAQAVSAAEAQDNEARSGEEARVVTTDSLSLRRNDWDVGDKTVARDVGTVKGIQPGRYSIHWGNNRGPTVGARWSRGRYYGGGSYNYTAPYPVAFHHYTDQRLDDLTVFVPSLYTDGFDLEREQLIKLAAKSGFRDGSVSKAARRLIELSRATAVMRSYTDSDSNTVSIDAAGAIFSHRTLPTGLKEQMVYDGSRLYHLYAELGLAVRRDVGDAEAALLGQIAPFLLARPDTLARWYDVTADDNTISLSSIGSTQPVFEISLDSEMRIETIRHIGPGTTKTVWASFEYSGDTVTIVSGDERRVLSVATDFSIAPFANEAEFAVAEMPLRQPKYWKDLEGEPGTAKWRHAQRQLLMSYAALSNAAEQKNITKAMLEHSDSLSDGELVLASLSLRSGSDKDLAATGNDSAIAAYIRASRGLVKTKKLAALDRVAKSNADTLLGTLATHRATLYAVSYQANDRLAAKKRALSMAKVVKDPQLRYIVAHLYNQRWSWQDWAATATVWGSVADTGPWSMIAQYEAARSLYNAGKYDDAADRFAEMFDEAVKGGPAPPIDYTVYYAFVNGGRGQAGWQLFWSRWRKHVLDGNDAQAIVSILQASQYVVNRQQDVDRIAARLAEVVASDAGDNPHTALAAIDVLQNAGRPDQASALLDSLLEAARRDGDDAPALLERASRLAEQQGRIAEAADYFERAMTAFYDEPAGLGQLRGDYARLINLHARVARATTGDVRAESIERALAAAAKWRTFDPDNPQIDQLSATLLYSMRRPQDAWRYLSTAIERHPGEASALSTVANTLEQEGMVSEAAALWKRATKLEPTNPTWLLRRSQALFALGQRDRAAELLDQIVEGKWHERFVNVTYQAKRLRNK